MTIVRELIKNHFSVEWILPKDSVCIVPSFSLQEKEWYIFMALIYHKKTLKSLNLTFWTFIAVAYVKYSLVS